MCWLSPEPQSLILYGSSFSISLHRPGADSEKEMHRCTNFYRRRNDTEHIITFNITVWQQAAQRQRKSHNNRSSIQMEKLSAVNFLHDIATARGLKRASTISSDSTHPGNKLFQLRADYRSIKTHTSRFRNSFPPKPYIVASPFSLCSPMLIKTYILNSI